MTDVCLLTHIGGTSESRGADLSRHRGGMAAGTRLEAARRDCQSPAVLEKVHLCFIRWSHFLKSRWLSISAALGWVVRAFVGSPGLGRCLRWGHVEVPGKSEGIDRLQRAAPPASRIPRGGGAAAAGGAVGTAPASEPISHQMSPSAASASDSPAHNVPGTLNA